MKKQLFITLSILLISIGAYSQAMFQKDVINSYRFSKSQMVVSKFIGCKKSV